MTWSMLRSTAVKKISFRVAIAISSFGSPKRICLVAMYCFQGCVGNVKGVKARYSDASWGGSSRHSRRHGGSTFLGTMDLPWVRQRGYSGTVLPWGETT